VKAAKFNSMCKRQDASVVKLFQQRVKTEPHKTCFYFEDTTWTVADVSNDVTNREWFQASAAVHSETFALLDCYAALIDNSLCFFTF